MARADAPLVSMVESERRGPHTPRTHQGRMHRSYVMKPQPGWPSEGHSGHPAATSGDGIKVRKRGFCRARGKQVAYLVMPVQPKL